MGCFQVKADSKADTSKPDITDKIVTKWQKLVDLMSEIIGVPAGLIMKVHSREIEVFVSSHSEDNPYERGEKATLNTGLYCETVMATRSQLLVPDARNDAQWADNPDIKLGMVSYLGLPLIWPDGDIFGTICALDNKENPYSVAYQKLLAQLREAAEADLRIIFETEKEWKTTFNCITDMVSIHDKDYKLVRVNKAFADALRTKPEELIGKTCYEVFHGTKEPPLHCPHKKALDTGKAERREFFEPHLGIHMRVSISPIFNERDEMTGSVHIAEDITERKKMEEETRRHSHDLEVFYNASRGREDRIVELKKTVRELEKKLAEKRHAGIGVRG